VKVGDLVKIKNDSFRSGQTGVVIRVNVYNEQLKVNVHLVRIDDRELWFTSYELETTNESR
jgi:transcription antitermination factor NusG